MIKEGCKCNHFWTEGSPLTLKEFNKKYIIDIKNLKVLLRNSMLKIDMFHTVEQKIELVLVLKIIL